jgi:hypothetical protein
LEESFDEIFSEFGKVLTFALQRTEEINCCRVALHSTSDVVRALGPKFSKYMGHFLPIVLKIINVILF